MQILENNEEIVKHRKSKIKFDLKNKMGVIKQLIHSWIW